MAASHDENNSKKLLHSRFLFDIYPFACNRSLSNYILRFTLSGNQFKIKFFSRHSSFHFKDIVLLRDTAFMFKTAEFTKRNWSRFSYCLSQANGAIWHGISHVTKGLKQLSAEGVWVVK